ncbi:MAG TPA: glycosyltransferase family 4 protein [Terriglobales bacterium]|nr:glycosyltransferase family 4 protein [Terriglobales bacterium]
MKERTPAQSAPWVLVAGDFRPLGGMDKSNFMLAQYLVEQNIPVFLVAHSVDPALRGRAGVQACIVPKFANSYLLAEGLLRRRAREVITDVCRRWPNARVLANGGNCDWPDINWVHCVHHAWPCRDQGAPLWSRAKNRLGKFLARRSEQCAIARASLVLANSERTRDDLIRLLQVKPERVHAVYPGADPESRPPSSEERSAARQWLGFSPERPLIAFIGGLGHDHNKGFDTLWSVFRELCRITDWDANLVVAGAGRNLPDWRFQIAASDLEPRVRMLGVTDRVPEVLAAADLLVSPVRYEGFGMNVQEAICRGVPAMVTASAGVAEHYPDELRHLLIPNPDNCRILAEMLRRWRKRMPETREAFLALGSYLRRYTWRDMAERIVNIAADSVVEVEEEIAKVGSEC